MWPNNEVIRDTYSFFPLAGPAVPPRGRWKAGRVMHFHSVHAFCLEKPTKQGTLPKHTGTLRAPQSGTLRCVQHVNLSGGADGCAGWACVGETLKSVPPRPKSSANPMLRNICILLLQDLGSIRSLLGAP